MVLPGSFTEHAHSAHTPGPTAWALCAGTATVLVTTALLTTTLQSWRDQPRLYRPLSLTCVAAAVACIGLGAMRPTPLLFGLALVVLLGIPWVFAVAGRATQGASVP